ncbi:mRNA cleavage and polyadenylation factor CLP1 P-loop, partial [Rhizoctonia solani]
MSGGPALSAIARRKAKIEAAAANASISTQKTDGISKAQVDTASSAIDTTSIPTLKRKAPAPPSRHSKIPTDQVTDSYSRKKARAHPYSQVIPAVEKPTPLDYTYERPYSPSRPFNSSEEEVITNAPTPEKTGTIYTSQQAAELGLPVRPNKNIPTITEKKNCFTLIPDDVDSVVGRRSATKIVLLNQGESLLFVGTMELTLLQGHIQLLGTTLSPSKTSHKIFAPRSHPIPVLDALGPTTNASFETLSQNGPQLISNLPKHIVEAISPSHVVLVLQELLTGVEQLGQVVRTFAGVFEPDVRDNHITQQVFKSAHLYRTESQFDSSFDFPDDWQQAIATILSVVSKEDPGTEGSFAYDAPVILVRGSKNSGKSTFSRVLANNLTSRYHSVAFIDCDLGQSEFTPGGMVSLNVLKTPVLGPPFTHDNPPRYAHFIGGNSPKTSPSHYLAALGDLAQRYQLELKYSESLNDENVDNDLTKNPGSVPLVINTQGWVKGLGADLLRSIEGLFTPTHIVEFQTPRISSSFDLFQAQPPSYSKDFGRDPSTNPCRLINLSPILPSSRSPRFSAADLRSLTLASYFYSRNHKDNHVDQSYSIACWDTSLSMRNIAPISIDIRSALESITIVSPTGDDVVQADISRAIVCGIVGLVVPDFPSKPAQMIYAQGALPPPPQNSRCIGLGFVRGASATHLHLLTPVPANQLRLCRILVLGELTMPVWAFLDPEKDTNEEDGLPFLQWGRSIAEEAGGERKRIRRNIMRRGQL